MKASYLALIGLMVLAACTQVSPEPAGASIQNTFLATGHVDGTDISLTNTVHGALSVASDSANDSSIKLSIYGRNTTHWWLENVTSFNATTVYTGNSSWTRIDKLVLNDTAIGTVTVKDNVTGVTIATFTTGDLEAYSAAMLNGDNYMPPVVATSQVIDVRTTTEFKLFTDCDTVNATNVTFSYEVSPDGTQWFDGAVTVTDCSGTEKATALTDSGIAYINLTVNNTDTLSNKVYAKLLYK